MTAVALLLLLAPDSELTAVDQKALQHLTKTIETPSILFHHAPELPATAARKAVRLNRGFYAYLEQAMKMRYEGRVHVFLYRDAVRMKAITGSGAAAFANGTRSIHQPHDYDDAHEMVHVFALQIPKGEEHLPPDGFFVEGLATALQKEDNGIAIDDYAAVCALAGRLPRLVELRRTWPEGAPAGVHPYHVAGSFLGFLIETCGIEKVKRLYTNCLECQGVLGKSFARLEREWWDELAKRRVAKEPATRLLGRLGFTDRHRLAPELARAKGKELFNGKSLSGWNLEHRESWRVERGLIRGSATGPWHRIHTKRQWRGDIAVRIRLRLVEGNAVQVRLNRDATRANEAILATWESFLVRAGPGGGVLARNPYRIRPGRWVDLVFVNEGGHGRVYADGLLILEAKGIATNEGAIGLNVERGTIEIASVTLLDR